MEHVLFITKDYMKKLLLSIFLFIPLVANATPIVYGTTYSQNGQVTNVNLNGNFQNAASVVNGKLDNSNADTTDGYFFFQKVAILPASGIQGATYFLTADNTLNLDTGSTFVKSVVINGTPVQGDVIYYNGSAWTRLAAGTAGQALITKGAGQNPVFSSEMPIGGIVMWSGTIATIPTNFQLCDGTNGTPDLRDRFIVGARQDSVGIAKTNITGSLTQSGGSTSITTGNLPASGVVIPTNNSGASFGSTAIAMSNQAANTTVTSNNLGSGTAYTQPYFALAYIERMN